MRQGDSIEGDVFTRTPAIGGLQITPGVALSWQRFFGTLKHHARHLTSPTRSPNIPEFTSSELLMNPLFIFHDPHDRHSVYHPQDLMLPSQAMKSLH